MREALERFLLPNVCVACERRIDPSRPDDLVCGTCRARLRVVPAGCARCRQPMPPVGPCRFCRDWPAALTWVRSAVWLGEEARAILHHLKYEGYPALAAFAADLIVRTMPERPRAGVVCPIPLGSRRRRHRGYNQAERIAAALANRWGLPLGPELLTRTRETPSQTALDRDERRRNVTGAFTASTPPSSHVAETQASGGRAAVILVDDVLTTGATLAAAAAAFAAAGWSSVGAVTFARAVPAIERLRSA